MNTIKQTVLTTSAALALVGGVVLAPLAAHGEASGPVHHDPVTVAHQQESGPGQQTAPTTQATGAPTQQPDAATQPLTTGRKVQPSDGKDVVCTGSKPELRYTPGGTLTNDTVQKLLAAGCKPTDGTAFGWNEPAPATPNTPAPARDRGVTQPSTTMPRVAG
jgi:hypothetical protein